MNLDKDGTGDESTLVKRRPNDSEFLDLDAKIDKIGIEEVKTLNSNESTILDFKGFNYDNCSLIDCISLLQSVLYSPHAYSQNKAFTKHIVDAFKLRYIPPKHDISESLKVMRISIDECKERTARMRAKKIGL